jgi:hypothetical protein
MLTLQSGSGCGGVTGGLRWAGGNLGRGGGGLNHQGTKGYEAGTRLLENNWL